MRSKSGRTARLVVLCVLSILAVGALKAGPGTSAHDGHKRKNAPASARKLKSPISATDENITRGRALFNQNCASCHGEDGKGKTEIAASLKTKPADLSGSAMHGITDGEIYWVITNGIKKAAMPAYKTKVNDQERWQLTLYVKHLMGEHPHADHAAKTR